jgi:hypothetical protein
LVFRAAWAIIDAGPATRALSTAITLETNSMNLLRWVAPTLGVAALAGPAFAESAVIFPSKDNTLYQFPGAEFSNGVGIYMFAGNTNQPFEGVRRGVVKFNVASVIPAGATIDSVQLRVTVNKTQVGSVPFTLHRLTADWGEGPSDAGNPGGVGFPSQDGDASWGYRFYPDEAWDNEGGDFIPTVSSQVNLSGNGTYFFPTSPQFVADVQLFLDHPEQNFGWIICGNENIRSAKRLYTREHSNAAQRPALLVTFTPAPVFQPGDMNCDGSVSVSDIGPFVMAVTNPAGFAAAFPNCDIDLADLNGDGQVTVSDIGPFVELLTGV